MVTVPDGALPSAADGALERAEEEGVDAGILSRKVDRPRRADDGHVVVGMKMATIRQPWG
jgi:hypothetical protein